MRRMRWMVPLTITVMILLLVVLYRFGAYVFDGLNNRTRATAAGQRACYEQGKAPVMLSDLSIVCVERK